MVSTGSGNSGLINWDNSSSIKTSNNSLGGQMISTGSGNSGLINRDNSAIGVSDQLRVEVEGASIAVGRGVARVASVGNRGSIIASVSHSRGSSDRGSGIASIANSALEGQVVSTGSGHSGLINRDNSA